MDTRPAILLLHVVPAPLADGPGFVVPTESLPTWVRSRNRKAPFGPEARKDGRTTIPWSDVPYFWARATALPSDAERRGERRASHRPTLGCAPCPDCLGGRPCVAWAGRDPCEGLDEWPAPSPTTANLERVWSLLGLDPETATEETVRKAHKDKVRALHPDLLGLCADEAALREACEKTAALNVARAGALADLARRRPPAAPPPAERSCDDCGASSAAPGWA